MKIFRELGLSNFEAWSGATDTLKKIKEADKLNELEQLLEEGYPDGIDETHLNDLLWFESDWLFECLGIAEEED